MIIFNSDLFIHLFYFYFVFYIRINKCKLCVFVCVYTFEYMHVNPIVLFPFLFLSFWIECVWEHINPYSNEAPDNFFFFFIFLFFSFIRFDLK